MPLLSVQVLLKGSVQTVGAAIKATSSQSGILVDVGDEEAIEDEDMIDELVEDDGDGAEGVDDTCCLTADEVLSEVGSALCGFDDEVVGAEDGPRLEEIDVADREGVEVIESVKLPRDH